MAAKLLGCCCCARPHGTQSRGDSATAARVATNTVASQAASQPLAVPVRQRRRAAKATRAQYYMHAAQHSHRDRTRVLMHVARATCPTHTSTRWLVHASDGLPMEASSIPAPPPSTSVLAAPPPAAPPLAAPPKAPPPPPPTPPRPPPPVTNTAPTTNTGPPSCAWGGGGPQGWAPTLWHHRHPAAGCAGAAASEGCQSSTCQCYACSTAQSP